MERFRQLGEVLGGIKAIMVFRTGLQINQRQCCLLLDMFTYAYETVAELMIHNLKFEEKQSKWKVLDQPLRELHKVFKEGEMYIRHCFESKDWWAKALTLHQNTDCIQFHIHNLLCCIPIVIEAIEIAGEIAGLDHDDMLRKRMLFSKKYQKECKDPKVFQWRFGKEYLVTQEICDRLETAWREDKWILLNKIRERSISNLITKHEVQLTDLLLRKLNVLDDADWKLLPTSMLIGSKDYQVRRRLGNGNQYKEIIWFGETFVLRHLFTNVEPLIPQISLLHSLHHPNVLPLLCSFVDDEKKELFLVMEIMSRNLDNYIKEISGTRKRIPFTLPVAVDLMLQIARGMEYLHSKKIYHGDLNPSNVFVKARGVSSEGYLHAKISGFGLSECISSSQKSSSKENGTLPFIWHAPEVLAEQEESVSSRKATTFSEKSDVYSFGMICFELLTGKVPFEDLHLQGDKMSRNIRAGERPLFPFHTPKYLVNLTKRCWHIDPIQRPSFSSICRILRYVKRFLVMNPEYSNHADPPVPPVDYLDIESRLLRSFPYWEGLDPSAVHEIPFQMFVYRVVEHEKTSINMKETSESGSEGTSVCGDENVANADDSFQTERKLSLSPDNSSKNLTLLKRLPDIKILKQSGTPKGRSPRPPHVGNRSMRMNSESQLLSMSPKIKRATSGHSSDSEVA